MIPIVVLASGRGSNFVSIQQSIDRGDLPAEIVAVISDRPNAPVLEKAKNAGLKAFCVPPTRFHSGMSVEALERRRLEHESRLFREINQVQPRFLVLAGYMRVFSQEFIEAFRGETEYTRIVNVHPSLLPSFPGMNSYRQAFQYGVQVSGVTVHLVEAQVDCGPICAQSAFSMMDCQTVEEVEEKGLRIEHRLYPETLRWILPEKFRIEKRLEGRLFVRPN